MQCLKLRGYPSLSMLDLNRMFKDDRLMRSLTGVNLAAFDQRLPSFSAAYQAAHPVVATRVRKPGAGRRLNLLEIEDKLFFVLFYFKCYPTVDLSGLLFDYKRPIQRPQDSMHQQFSLSQDAAESALHHCGQNTLFLPMVLWQYDLVSLSQLD